MQKVKESLSLIVKKVKELFRKFRRWICGCECYMCKYCSSYNFDDNDWEDFMDFDIIGYESAIPPKEKKPKKKSAPAKAVKKAAKKIVNKVKGR